jgi:hypothetical protein
LKDPTCSVFISGLLNQLTSDTGKKAFSTNAMQIFKAVEQQGGFGRREIPASAEGGNTVGNGNAFINIGSNFFISSNPMGSASNGRVIVHELLHVGSGTNHHYSHYEMARAAFDVAQAQGYKGMRAKPSGGDPGGRDRPNSDYFTGLLFKACHVR